MAIYIAVSPLQWRWSVSIDGAIKKSLSTYKAKDFLNIKMPVKVYLLKRKVDQMYKKDWVLGEDATYLGIYRAFPKSGKWKWYGVKHNYEERRKNECRV